MLSAGAEGLSALGMCVAASAVGVRDDVVIKPLLIIPTLATVLNEQDLKTAGTPDSRFIAKII